MGGGQLDGKTDYTSGAGSSAPRRPRVPAVSRMAVRWPKQMLHEQPLPDARSTCESGGAHPAAADAVMLRRSCASRLRVYGILTYLNTQCPQLETSQTLQSHLGGWRRDNLAPGGMSVCDARTDNGNPAPA